MRLATVFFRIFKFNTALQPEDFSPRTITRRHFIVHVCLLGRFMRECRVSQTSKERKHNLTYGREETRKRRLTHTPENPVFLGDSVGRTRRRRHTYVCLPHTRERKTKIQKNKASFLFAEFPLVFNRFSGLFPGGG